MKGEKVNKFKIKSLILGNYEDGNNGDKIYKTKKGNQCLFKGDHAFLHQYVELAVTMRQPKRKEYYATGDKGQNFKIIILH